MIVDCDDNTINVTTQTLLEGKKLGDITGRIEDWCGGSSVDEEFLKFLGHKIGQSAINLLKDNDYGQLQYMIQNFHKYAKHTFTGQDRDFRYELDLEGEKNTK